jgi:hypothetical protein
MLQKPDHRISTKPRTILLLAGTIVLGGLLINEIDAAKVTKVQVEVGGPTVKAKQGKGPPSHAPAHGYRRKFSYHYYPQAEIYHDVERGLWFYTDGKEWKAGAKVPIELGENLGGHVVIELESDSPQSEHPKTRETYPQEKREDGAERR